MCTHAPQSSLRVSPVSAAQELGQAMNECAGTLGLKLQEARAAQEQACSLLMADA